MPRNATATGGKGFPDLTAGAWLWGGDPETVAETLRVGINSTHEETRVSQMLAFGRDGMLDRAQINDVVAYVQSLGGSSERTGATPEAVAARQGSIRRQLCRLSRRRCQGQHASSARPT